MQKQRNILYNTHNPLGQSCIHIRPEKTWQPDRFSIDQFNLSMEKVYPDIRPWHEYV